MRTVAAAPSFRMRSPVLLLAPVRRDPCRDREQSPPGAECPRGGVDPAELLALLFLFAVMQSASARQFGLAVLAMAVIVVVIPLTFRFFGGGAAIRPALGVRLPARGCAGDGPDHARTGVYYLLGAFLVGVAAQRFRAKLPALSSEKMVDALEAFGSVFIPFYFFVAGTPASRTTLPATPATPALSPTPARREPSASGTRRSFREPSRLLRRYVLRSSPSAASERRFLSTIAVRITRNASRRRR